MVEEKWDSLKLRRHLRALSGLHDEQLKSNNLNPDALRKNFYKYSVQCYDCLEPNHAAHSSLSKEMRDCQSYMIVDIHDFDEAHDLDDTDDERFDEYDKWQANGYRIDNYLFIGKRKNGEFFTCRIKEKNRIDCASSLLYFEDSDIVDEQKANFVDITAKYGLLIVDICEKWGYDTIVKWIKDND